MAAMLRAVGIRAALKTPEWPTLWSDVQKGRVPFYYMGRGLMISGGPAISQYFETDESPRIGYSNTAVDSLLRQLRATFDKDAYAKTINRALSIILDDAPAHFLWQHNILYGVSNDVKFTPRPDHRVFGYAVSMTQIADRQSRNGSCNDGNASCDQAPAQAFNIVETTISDIHAAYKAGTLTVRQLVQMYLDRIAAYDKKGPAINCIISLNPTALEEADRLDAAFRTSGFIGPLHGIPVIMKDQADIKGMPTTLGSVLFKDYMPDRDCFVVAKLKKAGVIFIGKATLGELGGGDTHGSLFGSTRNVYDLERTAGGSSGGSGASVSANFCTVAVGQEGFASIRRPSTWNGVAGMRPTIGLVSRGGVYGGWPTVNGSLGPMARTVTDLAKLLDSMVGYDPDDPVTGHGVGKAADSYSATLDKAALKGARIGILRESMGYAAEPDTDDFKKVSEVFDKAVADLRKAGAEIVDPIVIPDLKALIAKRARSVEDDDTMFELFFKGGKTPFATRARPPWPRRCSRK